MEWFYWVLIVIVILGCGLVGYAMLTALRMKHPVGFQIIKITDPSGHPFAAALWYPTQAQPEPTTILGAVLMNVARGAPISGHDLPPR